MRVGFCMKLLFVLFLSFSSFAVDRVWKINQKGNNYYIEFESFSYHLDEVNVKPKLIEVKKYGTRFEAVVYFSNSYGTTVMIDEYYAALFDTKLNKFLGTFPYKYESMKAEDRPSRQPVWKFDGKKLVISDFELGLEKSFSVK